MIYSLCILVPIFFFPYFIFFWVSCIVLFAVYTLLFLFTVHVVCLNFSTSFTYWRSGTFFLWCPNLWQLGHSSRFRVYILTLVIVYPIFISVGGFGVLKLRIYVFVRIVWLFFLMEILRASVTLCLQRLVFILSQVQRERSGLLTSPFDEFRELSG